MRTCPKSWASCVHCVPLDMPRLPETLQLHWGRGLAVWAEQGKAGRFAKRSALGRKQHQSVGAVDAEPKVAIKDPLCERH